MGRIDGVAHFLATSADESAIKNAVNKVPPDMPTPTPTLEAHTRELAAHIARRPSSLLFASVVPFTAAITARWVSLYARIASMILELSLPTMRSTSHFRLSDDELKYPRHAIFIFRAAGLEAARHFDASPATFRAFHGAVP